MKIRYLILCVITSCKSGKHIYKIILFLYRKFLMVSRINFYIIRASINTNKFAWSKWNRSAKIFHFISLIKFIFSFKLISILTNHWCYNLFILSDFLKLFMYIKCLRLIIVLIFIYIILSGMIVFAHLSEKLWINNKNNKSIKSYVKMKKIYYIILLNILNHNILLILEINWTILKYYLF